MTLYMVTHHDDSDYYVEAITVLGVFSSHVKALDRIGLAIKQGMPGKYVDPLAAPPGWCPTHWFDIDEIEADTDMNWRL